MKSAGALQIPPTIVHEEDGTQSADPVEQIEQGMARIQAEVAAFRPASCSSRDSASRR